MNAIAVSTVVVWLALPNLSNSRCAPRSKNEPKPGAQFSSRVAELADAGWRLAKVDVDDPERGEESTLVVVLVSNSQARALTLSFSRSGQAPLAFTEKAATPPLERLVYRNAELFYLTLARGPVTSLTYECDSYFMAVDRGGGTETGLDIDPLDYFVVERSVNGESAKKALAAELLKNGGGSLVAVRHAHDERAGESASVEFVWSHTNRESIVRVGLGAQHEVVSVEVHRGPARPVLQRLRASAQRALLAAVRKAGKVNRVQASSRGATEGSDRLPLTLEFERRARFELRGTFFGPGDLDCPC